MKEWFEGNLPVCALLPDADPFAGNPATDVYNMKLYDRIVFIIIEGAGGTGTYTPTVEECTAADGTGATAIAHKARTCASAGTADTWTAWTAATTAGIISVAGANKMIAIEVKASELSADSPFIRLQITETDSTAVDGCIMAILSEPTYGESIPLTAVT